MALTAPGGQDALAQRDTPMGRPCVVRHPHPQWHLPRTVRVATAVVALWLAVPVLAAAEKVSDVPNPRVRDGSWVVDLPGRLRPETVARLNALCGDLERTAGAEFAIVVVHTIGDDSIEHFAAELFRTWGIGKRNADNGLLLLWAVDDRRTRVEVGYGLEGVLPDGKVGAILDRHVIPHFTAGDFDTGILVAAQALDAAARSEADNPTTLESEADDGGNRVLSLVLGALGLLPVAGGGVAGYRRWRRVRRRRCPECGARMTRLSDEADDEHLDEGARAEERLGSVDYDVWRCSACAHHFTLRYPKRFTWFDKCPQCGRRTCGSSEETIRAATTTRTGSVRVTERCEFCRYRRNYRRTLPMLSSSSSSSSSSDGGAASGGSSFGGGSSGGGGASRGY